jgi:hypothetical protein
MTRIAEILGLRNDFWVRAEARKTRFTNEDMLGFCKAWAVANGSTGEKPPKGSGKGEYKDPATGETVKLGTWLTNLLTRVRNSADNSPVTQELRRSLMPLLADALGIPRVDPETGRAWWELQGERAPTTTDEEKRASIGRWREGQKKLLKRDRQMVPPQSGPFQKFHDPVLGREVTPGRWIASYKKQAQGEDRIKRETATAMLEVTVVPCVFLKHSHSPPLALLANVSKINANRSFHR